MLTDRWGRTEVLCNGERVNAMDLPGLAAFRGGMPVGLLTYRLQDQVLEIVTLDVIYERQGIGSILVDAAISKARDERLGSVQVFTSNDRLEALRFYQRRGFHLFSLRPGVFGGDGERPRRNERFRDGIEVRDEIGLRYPLEQAE